MTITRTITLELDHAQEEAIDKQIARLKARNVLLSDHAVDIMFLAIAGIVTEPSRNWPAFVTESEEEKISLRDGFIDALAFHFLSLAYELRRVRPTADNPTEVKIFDAIDAIAGNKWSTTWCRITATGIP